jgi:hypothetical protein
MQSMNISQRTISQSDVAVRGSGTSGNYVFSFGALGNCVFSGLKSLRVTWKHVVTIDDVS